jgi:hypothetical protein
MAMEEIAFFGVGREAMPSIPDKDRGRKICCLLPDLDFLKGTSSGITMPNTVCAKQFFTE